MISYSESSTLDIKYLANMYEVETFKNLSFIILLIIYPFRLFFWLTWFKYFQWLQQYLTTIFKILPGVIMFAVMAIVVIRLSVSNVYFLMFKESLFMFQNIYATWFNFFFFNPNLNNDTIKHDF